MFVRCVCVDGIAHHPCLNFLFVIIRDESSTNIVLTTGDTIFICLEQFILN